jgi:hypothetical protein
MTLIERIGCAEGRAAAPGRAQNRLERWEVMDTQAIEKRRAEIAKITAALEGERYQLERRICELYDEDYQLWIRQQDLLEEASDER